MLTRGCFVAKKLKKNIYPIVWVNHCITLFNLFTKHNHTNFHLLDICNYTCLLIKLKNKINTLNRDNFRTNVYSRLNTFEDWILSLKRAWWQLFILYMNATACGVLVLYKRWRGGQLIWIYDGRFWDNIMVSSKNFQKGHFFFF